MEEKEARRLSLEVIEAVGLSYLSTVDSDGFPQTRAMANLRHKEEYPELVKLFKGHDEDLLIYFATGTKSAKMGHIKSNAKASVYFCDQENMGTVLLVGSAEVVTDAELKKAIWQDRWVKHFPKGVNDPEYAVIRFFPAFARGWCPQGAFEFDLKRK